MKKIIIIYNVNNPNQVGFRFAVALAKAEQAALYALFITSSRVMNDDKMISNTGQNIADVVLTSESDDALNRQRENVHAEACKKACNEAGVPFSSRAVRSHYLDAIIDHTAFADLIICDAPPHQMPFSISNLSASSHCPVLIVNADYQQTDTLVFTYDDKSSSIHAIKYFTYLFQTYKMLPVHFVSVVSPNVIGIEYADLIKEWLPLHYPDAEINILKGDAKQQLTSFINTCVNPLVVMGAFGRSSLSRFFKESLANHILEQTNAPIFITHD